MSTIKSSSEHLTLNADGALKDIILQNNGSTKVTVKSDGKVGIGTSSPGVKLAVYNSSGWGEVHFDGTSGGELALKKNGTTYGGVYASDSTGFVLQANGASTPLAIRVNAAERMRIDSAGRVTMPYQPAFCASTAGAGKNSQGRIDIWDTVHTNIGNHFSSGGLFTAPITGVYLFTAGIMSTGSYSHFTFYKNGTSTNGYFHSSAPSGGSYNRASGTAYIYLVANESVGVGSTATTYTYGTAGTTAWSQFSGHLIG